MKKIKKLFIGSILSLILCLCYVLIPKADINSVGSEILNDNNITYYYEYNESTAVNELISGVGFYINYLDYINFSVYAGQLNYIPGDGYDFYILFAYDIIDSDLNNEWYVRAFISRSSSSNTSDYEYSLVFNYNLPQLGSGEDVFINSNGFNTDSLLYGLVSGFLSTNNLDLIQANLLKVVCFNFFINDNYILDVELTPSNNYILFLGEQNSIIKNLFSGLPFTQGPINQTYNVSYNLSGCTADSSNPTEVDPDDENYIFRFNADRNNTLINATVNVEGAEILNIVREERTLYVVIYGIYSDVSISVYAERTPYEVNVIYKINNDVVLTGVLQFKDEQFNIILDAKLNNLTELRTDNIYSGTLALTQPNNQIFTINNYYGYSDIIYSFFGQKVSLISVQTPSGGLSRTFNETEVDRNFNLREFAEEQGVLNWLTITDNDQTIEINIMSNGNIETEQDQIIGITSNIFDGFSKLLNMTIGFISIGQIISIILVFSLLAFIIRMWKGGSGTNG